MPGIIGKLLILVAIVATAMSGLGFLKASGDGSAARFFKRVGRAGWLAMTLASLASFGLLMWLSVNHRFEYAYVFENTSLALGLDYLIAATWAGQEGSFLLWIVMNALVGLAVIRFARDYEAPVMAVIALCQFFLLSMIVGLQLGPLSIGASPFATLAEKFPDAPMIQAGVLPTDGQGLNDLLQNYWMVIHPPVLFSGFASMIVPFAFAVTALWKRKYTQWVRPALPWTLFAVMALGVGITLGGYWAYETLSFGGYWAWDPVENSSLVPWLIGIAAVHTMIVQKRSGHSQKASLFLAILAYMLVVYSTFLTRSGILGDISVHSFVDLGLYNQLLLWILTMGVVGFGLFALRYRELPVPEKEPSMLSREFMIFSGAMLLCAVAAVIITGTSAPILGRIFRDSPSAVPLEFYNKWTLPLSVLFVFLAGLGQLFWWNRMSV
ncbi:MAG: cytochrome c biogenesis protein CcsA, partial [Rhodothermales bacterium]|nr:cytochrome c biogenesis protein CcsA [Rhodothermales bacterium]